MTSIIESLLAAFKDFHWRVSIDTLLIFFVNYLMFHAAGRVKISWWLLLLGGLLSVVLTPLLPMGFKFLLNPLILFCFSYFYIRRFTSCYLLSDSVCSPHEFLIMDYAAACHEDGYKGSQWQY